MQLVGDLALARLGQPHDLWIDIAGEDGRHDQEGDQLDDHRSVDVDDAGRAREKQHYFGATWLMNTNPNARLMKYIASTSPTIVKSQGIILPCASGCLATPLMNALPAKPSPTAAPMAPRPRARPKPMSGPARGIPWSVMFPPNDVHVRGLRARPRNR